MKGVLERVEEITNDLSRLKLRSLKLLNIKVAIGNPSSGSFRLKGFLNEKTFIEIFEFLLKGFLNEKTFIEIFGFLYLGEIIKYSYIFVENDKAILRYDNAPHHTEIQTFPHHKHLKDEVQSLENFQLGDFLQEVISLKKK